jgi:hypothetical protein
MPQWSHDLPSPTTHRGYDLRRTPPDRPLTAIITSEEFHVCFTHYWGGRTVPCEKPDCDACNALSPARAHVYVSAFDPRTHEHFLFECTAAAADAFRAWRHTYGTMRGCYFQASRPKRRRNAKVEIITKPCDLTKVSIPKAPNVPYAMSVIWQIPGTALPPRSETDQTLPEQASRNVIDRMRVNEADFALTAPPTSGNGSR